MIASVNSSSMSNEFDLILRGLTCTHPRMRYCCHPKNCGHLNCPDCELFYDEGSDGGPPPWPSRPPIDASELLK